MMTTPELELIQVQLKSAIQNHQILVSKIKADLQNVELKTQLRDLQKQITVLSEKQRIIVQSLRKDIITKKSPVSTQMNIQPTCLPLGATSIAITTVPPAAHAMSQPAHLLLQPVVNQLIPTVFAAQSIGQPISPQICAMPQFVQSIGQLVTSLPQPAHINQQILPQPTNIQTTPVIPIQPARILPAPLPVSLIQTAVTNVVSSVIKTDKSQPSSPLRVPQYPKSRSTSQGSSKSSSSTSIQRQPSSDDLGDRTVDKKPTPEEKEVELKNKRYDRRRRTTANPLYNFEPDIFQEVRDLSCSKCGMVDNLIPCDTCHRAYHIHCVEPSLPSIPEGRWSCPKCHANGKSGTWSAETLAMVHNFIANKTAKEEEKRKLQRRSSDLLAEKMMIENKTKSLNETLMQQRQRKEELLERHRLTQQSVETMKNFIKVIQAS
ncbi:unnamed protein product [Mytilus edulis]|uniref:PHD-type domain-containing protein n=1 Tax=Mytilus edulis TaxID=6550 RepID=A0A8S3R8H5_MYTED|nr:unnamed protein product [Mytilus edulis]